jgi:hypothetical protein
MKTKCYNICKNRPIWELGEFGKNKNLENPVGSHQFKNKIKIREPIKFL